MMTDQEHELVSKLGECYTLYAGVTREDDPGGLQNRTEFASRVHDLQNAVLARAAARQYPSRYRL